MSHGGGGVSIGSIVGYLELDDRLTAGMATAATKFASYEAKFQKIGKGLSLAVTAPMVGALATAVAFGRGFEGSMTKIETLVGVNRNQVNLWKKDLLALSGEVGRAPKELADALFVVTSAGERGANALKILEESAKASAIGLGDTAVIARTVTGAMQAYKKYNLDAAEATRVMIATVQEGNIVSEDLAGSLGRVMGIASQAGVSFDQLGAFIATFTRVGVSAEEAVTALRGVLSTTIKPTQQAREALASLVDPTTGAAYSIDKLRESIRDKGLTQSLLDLYNMVGNNVDVLGEVIPNIRALSGFLGTAGTQGKAFLEITKNVSAAAKDLEFTDKRFERSRETLGHALETLKARGEAAAIAIGVKVIPHLTHMVEVMMPLTNVVLGAVSAFELLPRPLQGVVVGFLGLVGLAGPTMMLASKVMHLGTKLLGLAETIPVLTARVWLLNASQKAATVSTNAMTAAQAWLGSTSLVTGARMATAATMAKVTAASTGAMTAATTLFNGSAIVQGVQLAANAVKLKLIAPLVLTFNMALGGTSIATTAASAGTVALGIGLLALKWVILPVTVGLASFAATLKLLDWKAFNNGTASAAEGIEYFSLKVQRFIGLIDEATTDADLWNSVQENTKRRNGDAAEATQEHAHAVKALGEELSGQRVAEQVQTLNDAISKLTAEQLKAPEVLARVRQQLEPLLQAGAKLPPNLQSIASSLGLVTKEAGKGSVLTLADQYKRVQAEITGWSAATKANIDAGIKMHKSSSDIAQSASDAAKGISVTSAAVDVYTERMQQAKKATEAAESPIDSLKTKIGELSTTYAAIKELPGAGGQALVDWVNENAEALLKAARNAEAFGVATSEAFQEAVNQARALKAGEDFVAMMEIQRQQTQATAEAIREQQQQIANDRNQKLVQAFAVEKEFQEKLQDLSLDSTELKIVQIKREWDARVRALNAETNLTEEAYARQRMAIDAYYQNVLDQAERSYVSIGQLLERYGVQSTKQLTKVRDDLKRLYDYMIAANKAAPVPIFNQEMLDKIKKNLDEADRAIKGGVKSWSDRFKMIGETVSEVFQNINSTVGQYAQMIGNGLSKMFDSSAKSTERFAAGLSMVIGMLSGLAGSAGSRFSAAAMGAGIGAASGAMIGLTISSKTLNPVVIGLGAAIGALVGAIAGWVIAAKKAREADEAATKEIQNYQKELVKTYGSLKNISVLGAALGVDLAGAWGDKSRKGLENFKGLMDEFKEKMEGLQAALDQYGMTWLDLGEDFRRIAMENNANDLFAQYQLMVSAGADSSKVIRAMAGDFNQLIINAINSGQKIPPALQPILAKMIEMGALTDEAAKAMLGLKEDTMPALADIEAAAGRYGLKLEDLGNKVKQLQITEAANQIAADWEILVQAGAPVDVLLGKMGKSVQDLVTQALQFGLELPSSMRGVVQAMIEAGDLTDATGQALTDISKVPFAVDLAKSFDLLMKKLDELIDKLVKVGTTAANVPDVDVDANVNYHYTNGGGLGFNETVPWEDLVNVGDAAAGAARGARVTTEGLQYLDTGGRVSATIIPFRPKGTDTVPAMLTPGERVLSVPEADAYEAGGRTVTVNITLNFDIDTLDATDFQTIVETKAIPAITEAIKNNAFHYGEKLVMTIGSKLGVA